MRRNEQLCEVDHYISLILIKERRPPIKTSEISGILLYYIHTEKYSPKSYVVNFRTQLVLANQRSERWFSHVKRMIPPIRIANDVFSRVRKMIRPIRSHRGAGFAPKFSPFIAACSAASHTFNEKSFTRRVFVAKKVKNITVMEWNRFMCFTVNKENGREPAKKQRKGKNRTRRKLLLCSLSELLCLSFNKLKLILKPAILLKFTDFQLCIKNKQLRVLIVLRLPHILTVIYVFSKRFYLKADTSFSLSFCGKCVAAIFIIFEDLK